MSLSKSKLVVFLQRSLADGKKPNEDGYYTYTKNELAEGTGLSTSSVSKYIQSAAECFLSESKGWIQDDDTPISMICDLTCNKGILSFRRNPDSNIPELDYYWAPYPLYDFFVYHCYDDKKRRRYNGTIASFGYFPWDWNEEQVEEAFINWKNQSMKSNTYSYTKGPKKTPEQARIDSIKANGGCHLKNFKRENITYNMCLVAVEKDGNALPFVPEEYRTSEIYEISCEKSGMMLSRVPAKLLTKKMCEHSVNSEGLALQYVPLKYKTKELCRTAIINCPQAFAYTPDEYITPEFVVDIVRNSGPDAISSLPDSLKNNSFYLNLIELEPSLIWSVPKKALTATIGKATIKAMGYSSTADAIKAVPELLGRLHTSLYDHESCINFVSSDYFLKAKGVNRSFGFNTASDQENGRLYLDFKYSDTYSLRDMMKWKDVALPLLKLNGYYLKFVPESMIDEEMCTAAVEGNANCFQEIPKQFKTKRLCQLAFKKEPFNIRYFPEEFITPQLALKAVKHSGFLLEDIPDKYKTKEVCLIAVSDEGNGQIEAVPKKILDKEICLAWLDNSEWELDPLDSIPKALWDNDIFLAAVKLNASELKKIPRKNITYEICLAAIKKDNSAAKYVPKEFFTRDLALIMVKRSDSNFECIPKSILDEEICLKAIKHAGRYSGTALQYVPNKIITQKMCDAATDITSWALEHVPSRFVTIKMLAKVANAAPGRLIDNFPKRFRNKETIDKLIKMAPRGEDYLLRFLQQP